MTAGVLLVTAAGLLLAGGAVTGVCAWRGVSLWPARPARRRWRMRPMHAAAVGVGLLVLLVTGWPVAALAAGGAVVFVPAVLGGGAAAARQIARADALAEWARRLADLLSSGAAGSITDALARSAGAAPAAVAGPVRALVTRMDATGPEPALRRFAADAGDPAAQKIAGVLILRERHGGPGLADVLTELAADVEDRARMLREVESERARSRANARTIVIVSAVLVAGLMAFSRTFLSPYSGVLGQVLLAVVAGVFVAALRWLRRLSDPPAEPAVLINPAVGVTP